jgi:hypothetical protein
MVENICMRYIYIYIYIYRERERERRCNLYRRSCFPRIIIIMYIYYHMIVVDVFEMCLRTAFLAVNYTDRFLDIVMVKKTKFQLLGATCLHVASKCEDVSYIGVEDLSMCADNVYSSMEVLKMEEQLLNTLDFTLAVPTGIYNRICRSYFARD